MDQVQRGAFGLLTLPLARLRVRVDARSVPPHQGKTADSGLRSSGLARFGDQPL